MSNSGLFAFILESAPYSLFCLPKVVNLYLIPKAYGACTQKLKPV